MKNEFVPYDIALAMKGLGFREECLGFYDDILNNNETEHRLFPIRTQTLTDKMLETLTPAPLYQQAFRWFREKLKESAIEPYDMVKNYSYNMKVSWEEAQDACLRKLIEEV